MKPSRYTFPLITLAVVAGTLAVITACTGEQAKAKPNIVVKEAPRPGIVARINGEDITEDQLIGDDKLDFFDIKKHEYELKMERLNKLILEKMVGDEAKKANMSLEDYITKKVVGGEVKISDSEYKKFVQEKRVPENQLTPQLKERIISYLQTMKRQDLVQNYLAKVTKSNPVEVYFSKPKLQVAVDAGNGPWFGGENAKVTIVEFSDFQCPYCGRAAETVGQLKKKYGSKIKLYFRQFPLPMHPNARGAAEASLCVAEQSKDKFWKLHDYMFKNQDKLDATNLAKFAKDAGADPAKFDECVKSKKFSSKVAEETAYGEKIGVKSTPTFFINGQLVNGAVPLEQFSEIIDEELASSK